MITRQILNPKDSLNRIQRSDDGYFNATHFLNTFNQENSKSLKMAEFLKLKGTKEFEEYLSVKEAINKPIRSSTKGTWLHPKIFIDFCMWVSLEFKSLAIQWILDGLIQERNDVGDSYNTMCASICNAYVTFYNKKPSPEIYSKEASNLKRLVGVKDRNTATEHELKILNILQKFNTHLINTKVGVGSRHSQLEQLYISLK